MQAVARLFVEYPVLATFASAHNWFERITAASALGLGRPLPMAGTGLAPCPHRRGDWAHSLPTSAAGLGLRFEPMMVAMFVELNRSSSIIVARCLRLRVKRCNLHVA